MKILLDEILPLKLEKLLLIIAVLRGSDNLLRTLSNFVTLLFKRINEGNLPNVIEISVD
jgi:hypothetical protein